jgi:hypothetical protein
MSERQCDQSEWRRRTSERMGSRDRERIIGEHDVSASTECGDMIRTCSLQVIRLISQPIPLL